MNIFIVVKYRQGNDELTTLANTLAAATQAVGHLPLVGWREIRKRNFSSGREWMSFIKTMISTCALLVLVYDESLHGGFVELGIAYARAIPIWVLSRPGQMLSNSVGGCAEKIILYESTEALYTHLVKAYQSWSIKSP